jgi:NhaP-type Na+/H+ or K+/H+ antiporter
MSRSLLIWLGASLAAVIATSIGGPLSGLLTAFVGGLVFGFDAAIARRRRRRRIRRTRSES